MHGAVTNADQSIRLCINEWSPWFSRDLKYYGLTSRIVTEAFKSEGIKVIYVFRPWKRCLGEAKAGTIDGTPGWFKNKDRTKHYYFSKKIAETKNAFFYLKSTKFDWKSVDDLTKYKIGIVNGYSYGDKINNAEKEGRLTLIRSLDDKINFRQLFNKRVDVILSEFEVGKSILSSNYKQEQNKLVKHHALFSLTEDVYLLLSKKNAANAKLIKQFNKGLDVLTADGTVSKFYRESRRGDYKTK